MRKVFLEDLPQNQNGTISWKNSVGYKIRFEYDNINGIVEIIGYDNKKYHILLKYKDRIRSMFVGSFKNCLIQELIGLRHSEYYYDVGDIIHSTYLVIEQIKIPHAKTRNPNTKSRSGMNKAYVVKCLKCGYIFTIGEDIICSNIQESYCKACGENSKTAIRGYNDLWSTNQEIAKMLLNQEDGYNHLKSSNVKTNWVCPNCNLIIKNKSFAQVYYHGLACKRCGDGISYPEKVMRAFLEHSGLMFEMHKVFKWSDLKEYDFYLPDYNIIIETHGSQHYEKSFERMGAMTLEEVQFNDKHKKDLAIKNNIEKYIVIDCKESDFDYIYKNIEMSELNKIVNFKTINKDIVIKNSMTNYLIESCEMWNSGIKDINAIASKMNLSSYTIASYLKRCDKMGLCDYTKFMKKKMSQNVKPAPTKAVRCKTTNEVFNSMTEACNKYNIQVGAIRKSCLYPQYSAGKSIDGAKLYWEYINKI